MAHYRVPLMLLISAETPDGAERIAEQCGESFSHDDSRIVAYEIGSATATTALGATEPCDSIESFLAARPGASLRMIAAHFRVSRGNANGVLQALQADGLVVRQWQHPGYGPKGARAWCYSRMSAEAVRG